MNIKVILRDGSEVRIPSNGELAQSWLSNVRKSGAKTIPVGTTSFRVEDIMDAVDEGRVEPEADSEAYLWNRGHLEGTAV